MAVKLEVELRDRVGGRRENREGGHSVLRKVGHMSGLPNSNQLIALTMP